LSWLRSVAAGRWIDRLKVAFEQGLDGAGDRSAAVHG